jgi:hypothetical protein
MGMVVIFCDSIQPKRITCPPISQSPWLMMHPAVLKSLGRLLQAAGKVAPLPRDRFALQGGKQFGVMSVDILAEIRNAVIDPGCQIGDVNG